MPAFGGKADIKISGHHSRAFGREPAISISSRNLPSESGPGGDA
jgi:hypothetical protein